VDPLAARVMASTARPAEATAEEATSATSTAALAEGEEVVVLLVDQGLVGMRTETPSGLATDCFTEASILYPGICAFGMP
jgi:hypothetical protein